MADVKNKTGKTTIKTIVPANETILNNDQNNDQKPQNMADVKTENNDQNNDQKPPTTPIVKTIESLTQEIKDAKKILSTLNDKHDFDEENPEIIAQEKIVSDLHNEKKTLAKEIEKNRLQQEYENKLSLAKDDIVNQFGITIERLNELIAIAKDQSEGKTPTLIASLNTIFGKQPTFVSMDTKGTDLTKRSNNDSGINLSKGIKSLLEKNETRENILQYIRENSDLEETKVSKRFTDTKWQWEKETGKR